ncbi:hemolysin-III related-domain-containing protein [Boeremia exigua]|uniref:hemolysin-III related-domain-containing protein n=1 Tax=Boeremia exigua TaxID=749465 RepID=UPI001E8D05AC|nr:hemolysin-III related-domain-containing protein [Boeremia exigua]KAH6613168.1 hemolysin-III related-domain-containing protein [Boeremia exigua]
MRTEEYPSKLSRRRRGTTSYIDSVASIVRIHTETVNIWTHCLGALRFSASAARLVFAASGSAAETADGAVIVMYLAAAASCFLISSLYHTFANHARADLWQRIDHLGIVAVIWASSVSFTFFAFRCQPGPQWAHISLVTLASGWSLRRLWKIGCKYQAQTACQISSLLAAFAELFVANSIGGALYTTSILDDAIGKELGMPDASHHAMHVVVLFGAWRYQQGLLKAYRATTQVGTGFCG